MVRAYCYIFVMVGYSLTERKMVGRDVLAFGTQFVLFITRLTARARCDYGSSTY